MTFWQNSANILFNRPISVIHFSSASHLEKSAIWKQLIDYAKLLQLFGDSLTLGPVYGCYEQT